jgi:hypothetical protein
MREDCKFFQRRTSSAGDTVSFCALGLAPEAPWRCPSDCGRYAPLRSEAASGAPAGTSIVDEDLTPGDLEPTGGVGDLLGSAEEIISRIGPELAAEEQRERRARAEAEDKWWNRLRRSPRWRR